MPRGTFIVLEGLDRAGKSTQVNMLLDALKKRSIPVEKLIFPNRSTAIGGIINGYLSKKIELAPEAVHLLFSANRWEFNNNIKDTLNKGTTLIVDRYAASGAAYSAANTDRSLAWCRTPDSGLVAPDLVVYLDVDEEAQCQRTNWGDERYERVEIQRKVAANFRELADPSTWTSVQANQSKEEIHKSILDKVLAKIEDCKSKPIGTLD